MRKRKFKSLVSECATKFKNNIDGISEDEFLSKDDVFGEFASFEYELIQVINKHYNKRGLIEKLIYKLIQKLN